MQREKLEQERLEKERLERKRQEKERQEKDKRKKDKRNLAFCLLLSVTAVSLWLFHLATLSGPRRYHGQFNA